MKKIIPIIGLSTLTLLPLSNSAQSENQKKITNKTNKVLIKNFDKNKKNPENTASFGGIDISNKTHEEIINMPADSLPLETIREHMLIEINKIRDSLGINSHLKINNKVNDCTQEYAKYMYTNNWFEHEDKEKKNHGDRLKKYGFDRKNITSSSENLGKNQKTIHTILDSRLNGGSLPHRETLLEKRDNEIGIGYYKGFRVINIVSLRD